MHYSYLLIAAYLFFPVAGFLQMRFCVSASADPVETGALSPLSGEETSAKPDCRRTGRQLLLWGGLAALFALGGFFVLMGLPGIIAVAIYELLGITSGLSEGQKMWPAALMASLLWPLGIPIGIIGSQLLARFNFSYSHTTGFFIGFLAWFIVAGFILRNS